MASDTGAARRPRTEGPAWMVLTLVFVDELLAMAALGVWGWQVGTPRWLLVVLLPVVAMVVWALFASPRARLGGGGRRTAVKMLVFGLASWALWDAGHHGAALALLVFSVVVNAVAAVPAVAEVGRRT